MEKVDLKRTLKNLYAPSTKDVSFVDVPPMNFLMVDGRGDPNTSEQYVQALEALYSVAYTLKFAIKQGPPGIDYTVMPLEGLWWSDNVDDFVTGNKDRWQWTAMIMQPDFVTRDMFEDAAEKANKKKSLPALPKMRLEQYGEGFAAQIMYVGPYSDEGPTIARIHKAITGAGYELAGKHHEIYLGDPRRTAPERLMTVIRQPAKRAAR